MNVKRLDVPTAFLNGALINNIYIKPPEGITIESGKVLRLKKALYGIKEAPRCWNERSHKYILSIEFTQSKLI